jgi:hypothetical protein
VALAVHPKRALYAKVYIPLTIRWFEALEMSPAKNELLAAAETRELVDTLQAFNAICRERVDELLDHDMVRAAHELHQAILWVGDETPGPDPTLAQIRASLADKLRRNISLGILEAVLCLESGYHFARETLGLTGKELRQTLQDSRQLYASLAVLHDLQERQRLSFLTGREGYLEYPAVNYPDIISGHIRISADKFLSSMHTDGVRLRFVSYPVDRIDPADSGPTMRCPAHQASQGFYGGTYNDVLWDLLIDIYQRSGRFD